MIKLSCSKSDIYVRNIEPFYLIFNGKKQNQNKNKL